MRILLYILFLNPLLVGIADWYAFYRGGPIYLSIAFAVPIMFWAFQHLGKDKRSGVVNYLASLQTFYASSLAGGWVVLQAAHYGDLYLLALGGFLLLPAMIILGALLLAN